MKILRETNHSHQDRTFQAEVVRVEAQGFSKASKPICLKLTLVDEENDRSKIMRSTEIELKDHRSTKYTESIERMKSKDNSDIPDEGINKLFFIR